MARQVTFIHAADLHLGAPFRGLRALSEEWGDKLVQAIPKAYDRVINYAIQKKVDFVVIAGDIFDAAHPSYADYRVFFAGLKKLDDVGIPVYIVPGNHDPYVFWEQGFGSLPPNTTMISEIGPKYALFDRGGEPLCILAGRGYYNQSFPVDECVADGITRGEAVASLGPEAASAPFAVGVLHTGLETDTVPAKAPVNQARLLGADMDYWALGHIHARYCYPKENPKLSFSGIIQGRDIKETGPRGVNLVTLREGVPNQVEFLPCAVIVWQDTKVDISHCNVLADIENEVQQTLFSLNAQAYCEEMCARITLTGKSDLHKLLARPGVLEDVRAAINDSYDQFFVDAIVDETRAARNYDAIRSADLFPATLMDAAEAQEKDEEGTLKYLQSEFSSRGLALPLQVARSAADMVRAAQDDVLDLLEKEAR